MINNRTEITKEHLSLAEQWFKKHERHVRSLVANYTALVPSAKGFPPSGIDRGRPDWWKEAHWTWYLAREKEG